MAAGWSTQVPFIFGTVPPVTMLYSLRYNNTKLNVNDIIADIHISDGTASGTVQHIRWSVQSISGGDVYLLQGIYCSSNTANYFACNWGNVFTSEQSFTITIKYEVIYSDGTYTESYSYSSSSFTYQGKVAHYKWYNLADSRSVSRQILGYTGYTVNNNMDQTLWNSYNDDNTNTAKNWAWLVLYGNNSYTNNPYNRPPSDDEFPRGGNGTWDDHSDVIPVDPLPAGAWGQGFISVYNPTNAELQNFATQLWREDLRNTWKDLFPNGGVTSGIISCITIPVQPDTSGSSQIHVGGVAIASTSANVLANRFKVVDFGIAPIRYTMEYFSGFQDYLCTKIGIYLPYIGWEELSPEMVINCQLGLQYKIDCFTGDFVAILTTYREDKFSYQGVSYTFNGNCATQVPITSQSGGSSASMLSAAISGITSVIGGIASGNVGTAIAGGAQAANSIVAENSKHSFSLAGGLTGSKGQLSCQRPYLCINRPVMEDGVKNNYFNLCGIPSNDYAKISDCVGFTKAYEVKLDSTAFNDASDEELQAIVDLLKDGIFCKLG